MLNELHAKRTSLLADDKHMCYKLTLSKIILLFEDNSLTKKKWK